MHFVVVLLFSYDQVLSLCSFVNRELSGCLANQGVHEKLGEFSCALKASGKNQGIWLMLETMREISEKIFAFVSSINFLVCLEKLTRKQIMHTVKLWVFVFHSGNREHFPQISKTLLR